MRVRSKYDASCSPQLATNHVADCRIERPEATEGKEEDMASKTHWST